MSFGSVSEFFGMGGHGLYVWLAYSAGLVVVLANVVSVRWARQRTIRESRALEQRRMTARAGGTAEQPANPMSDDPQSSATD